MSLRVIYCACLIFLCCCGSPSRVDKTGIDRFDRNVSNVDVGGFRLGMTADQARSVYRSHGYFEMPVANVVSNHASGDHRIQKSLERIAIAQNPELFIFNSLSLKLTFLRDRIVAIDEQHISIPEALLRSEMTVLSQKFHFITNRTETPSRIDWLYRPTNNTAFAHLYFYGPFGKKTRHPMFAYRIVVADLQPTPAAQ